MVGMILATADRRHIALDFLVTRAGPRQRIALSILHHRLLGACAYAAFYCWAFVSRVAAIGQTSMALGVPMAIPHFALFVGFAGTTIAAALLLASDVAELPRAPQSGPHDLDARSPAGHAARARHADLRPVPRRRRPDLRVLPLGAAGRAAPDHVRRAGELRAARGAVLHLRRRADGRLGHRGPADRLGAGADRARARQPRRRDGRRLHADRRDFGRQHRDRRGGRPRALSEPGARRLRHALLGGPGLVERLDRHRDPAEHRDDPLWRVGRAVDRKTVRGRFPARPADRLHDVGLYVVAMALRIGVPTTGGFDLRHFLAHAARPARRC